MALPVVLTRRAARQVEDAIRDDLQAAAVLIGEQPMGGTPIGHPKHHGLRRIHLTRVGYHLYYRLAPRLRQVQVVAFWHARRGMPPPL